jgi:hypothetical protein
VEPQTVQVDFGILESFGYVGPGECFVARCVAVGLEPRLDYAAFLGVEEGCGGGVVVDEEIGDAGDEDCEDSFLSRC